jgi:hypothetical protein
MSIFRLEVLQAHRIARRQRDAANAAREALTETSSNTLRLGSWADNHRSTTTNGEGTTSSTRRVSATDLPAQLREFVNHDRAAGSGSFQSFVSQRNRENESRTRSQQEPRRRNSMIIAAAENVTEQETPSSNLSGGGNDTLSGLARLTLTPSRQALGSDSPYNPWAEIDALYRSRFPSEPPLDRSSRLRIEVEDEARRDFAHRLRRPWGALDEFSQVGFGSRDDDSLLRAILKADETMGISWSPDGRML